MIKHPVVSVVMITYGHEKFIEEAINGVLMQECDFELELIIANDCSPDDTDNIVQQILHSNPKSNTIKYLLHKQNKGMMANFVYTIKQARGKYIALCEGDDYWTDSLKLQKQVDFLEKNKNYSFCGHDVIIWEESKKIFTKKIHYDGNIIKIENTLFGVPIQTGSLMFRNVLGLPKNIMKCPVGDVSIMCYLASKGLGYSFAETMGVYRISEIGVWSSLKQAEQYLNTLKVQLWVLENFPNSIIKQSKRINELYSFIKQNNFEFNKKLNNREVIFLTLSLGLFNLNLFFQKVKFKIRLILKKK